MAALIDLNFSINDGVTYSALDCGTCGHTTPVGGTCLECQPFPTQRRCLACQLRPQPPAESPPPSETISPEGRNDPPQP